MNDTQLITKPSFEGDITAKIKSLGEITSNIEEAKNYANSLNEYYKNIIFTEESIAIAKEEKKKVNKFKDEVSKYRKDIINQFNEPIKEFEQLAKETESIFKNTYDIINNQVKNYEDKQKEEKSKEVESYFNEYKLSNNLDFVTYEMANINITLTASMKSLKEQAKEFIDKILEDIQLINTEEYKDEIMVEYKETLNASKSIMTVKNRMAKIEREKQIQENLKKQEEDLKEKISNFQIQKEETILQAPKIENINAVSEKKLRTTFTVSGTIEQLKKLKQYIVENNIEIIK